MGQEQSSASRKQEDPVSGLVDFLEDSLFGRGSKKPERPQSWHAGNNHVNKIVEKSKNLSGISDEDLRNAVGKITDIIIRMLEETSLQTTLVSDSLISWAMQLMVPCLENVVVKKEVKDEMCSILFSTFIFHVWYHPRFWADQNRRNSILQKYGPDGTGWGTDYGQILTHMKNIGYIGRMDSFWKEFALSVPAMASDVGFIEWCGKLSDDGKQFVMSQSTNAPNVIKKMILRILRKYSVKPYFELDKKVLEKVGLSTRLEYSTQFKITSLDVSVEERVVEGIVDSGMYTCIVIKYYVSDNHQKQVTACRRCGRQIRLLG
jgi:hypothetical protein